MANNEFVEEEVREQSRGWATPQHISSLVGGALIFVSAGMNMTLGLGWISMPNINTAFLYSWHICVIVGCILSIPLMNYLPKKLIMIVSSILVIIGGVLFTSIPQDVDIITAGRCINGLAMGLTIIAFLKHTSEISRDRTRGAHLAIEQVAVTFGIAIRMISVSQWQASSSFDVNRFHGILDIIFGLLALAALSYFIESPIDYIYMGDEPAALDCLSRLQRPQGVNHAVLALLEEKKSYVSEQKRLTLKESLDRSMLPLLKMIVFRSMMLAFTFSLPLNLVFQFTLVILQTTWTPILAGFMRIIGGFISLIIVDYIGRKISSILAALIMGALIVSIAIICNDISNLTSSHKMETVLSICLVVQFFAGIFTPFTSAYVGEAFPLTLKTYMIGVCVIIEQIIQIVVICESQSIGDDGTFMAEGIMILVAFGMLCLMMPETKKTSLTEAQDRFRKFFNWKMF